MEKKKRKKCCLGNERMKESGKCTYKGSCLSRRHPHPHIDQCKILSPLEANLRTMARPMRMSPNQNHNLNFIVTKSNFITPISIIYFTSSAKFFIMIHLSTSSFASLFALKNFAENFFPSSRIFSPGNIT